ncbi:MAG: TetR/AcrR family transcriptional regulator [Solirubrobacteraceae bacterium]
MPRRKTPEQTINTPVANRRKRTQRERIIAGMIAAANRGGYAGANVSAVIGNAGVSRPTFYDYFEDRDVCFRASIEDVQEELLGELSQQLEGHPPAEAMASAVRTLLSYAASQPARARFLMGEAMAGRPDALEVRDRGIGELAAAIERVQRAAPGEEPVPDLEGRVLIGTVYRMIATRLRRGEAAIAKLTEELLGWLEAYERPGAEARWQSLRPRRVAGRSAHVPKFPIQQMPGVLPPGRPRIPEAEIAENHRLRMLYAVARLAEEKGYEATTVADITKLASVDGRVFYRHFSDKQEAFEAVHELGFQQVMDVTARAFFAAQGWPERSWEAGRALTQLLQENPLVAHVGFVEAYAVGPAAIQRIEDSHTAFMFFLQEGLVYRPRESPPSRVAMEAIIASVFEVIYLQARRPGRMQIASMLPYIAHLWLTPFLGSEDADEFIERQLGSDRGRGRSAKR